MQNLRRSYPRSQRRVSRLCPESNDTTDRMSGKMRTSRIVTERETEFGSPQEDDFRTPWAIQLCSFDLGSIPMRAGTHLMIPVTALSGIGLNSYA
jgi:hypothetical protein